MYLLAFFSVIAATLFVMFLGDGPWLYRIMDLPTLIVMILLILPMLASGGLLRDFNNAFRFVLGRKKAEDLRELKRSREAVRLAIRILISGSVFLACLQGIAILYTMSDLRTLGLNVAIMLLAVLYGLAVSLLLFPVETILDLKIQDYISTEE